MTGRGRLGRCLVGGIRARHDGAERATLWVLEASWSIVEWTWSVSLGDGFTRTGQVFRIVDTKGRRGAGTFKGKISSLRRRRLLVSGSTAELHREVTVWRLFTARVT